MSAGRPLHVINLELDLAKEEQSELEEKMKNKREEAANNLVKTLSSKKQNLEQQLR